MLAAGCESPHQLLNRWTFMAASKRTAKSSRSKQDEAADDLVFKALANRDRRQILDCLRKSGQTTGDLCQLLPHLDRCTVMQHLKKLEQAQLIMIQRKGRQRWNFLNVVPIQRIYRRWIHEYAQPTAEWMTKLKDQLESDCD